MVCQICQDKTPFERRPCDLELVRDHDHQTGMIRGVICTYCNKALGAYETPDPVKRHRAMHRRRRQEWLACFQAAILAYLAQDTGIPYSTGRYLPLDHLVG